MILIITIISNVDLSFQIISNVSGATITVDDDGPANFPTIQEAVDAAMPGDTIYVYNGTYNEDIDISKSLIIIGEGRDGVIINGGVDYTFSILSANSVVFENLSVKGINGAKGFDGGDGIIVDNSSVIINNLKIEGGVSGEVSEPQGDYFKGGIGFVINNSFIIINNSSILGGNGIIGLNNKGDWYDNNLYGDGGDGSEAIFASYSDIIVNNSDIRGGNGGNGGYGGDGQDAGDWLGKKGGEGGIGGNALNINFFNLTINESTIEGGIGGNGGNGGNSFFTGALDIGGLGGTGGTGGRAISSEFTDIIVGESDIYGGNGGIGGKGGMGHRTGGSGGGGGNGGDGFWALKSNLSMPTGTIKSGKGGLGGKGGPDGGSGGHGGHAGRCLVGSQSSFEVQNITIISENGGNGGECSNTNNDGNGGNGGDGGIGIYTEYSNLTFSNTTIITGNGGTGRYGGYTTYESPSTGIETFGGRGGNGGTAGDSIVIFYSNLTAQNLECHSGNGSDGGYGGSSVSAVGGNGGWGGNGGSSIESFGSSVDILQISLIAGNGGNGSYGGDSDDKSDSQGGNGGKGGNGGRMYFEDSIVKMKFANFTAGNGGNGGNGGNAGSSSPHQRGGNGGNGGIGGDGTYAINSNVTFINSSVTCGYGGLGGANGVGTTPGTPGSNGRNGTIYIDPSHVIFLNSTLQGGDSDNPLIMDAQSTIEFQWFLHIGVKNSTGKLVRNADVIVKDNINGSFEINQSSGPDGFVRWVIVTEYIESQSGITYYTPHNITTIFNGNVSYVVPEPRVNKSMEIISVHGELKDYILLDPGWNLISIPRIHSNISIQNVLQFLNGQYDAVQWYNSSEVNDSWKHYHVSKSSLLNDLKTINLKLGFWIHITVPGGTTFVLDGVKPSSPQSIPLSIGWNHIGYPSLTSYNRTNGLNNLFLDQDVDAVQWFDSSTKSWHFMDQNDTFVPGRGYWIHSKVTKTWIVPI